MARRRTGTDMTRTEIILGGAALALYLVVLPLTAEPLFDGIERLFALSLGEDVRDAAYYYILFALTAAALYVATSAGPPGRFLTTPGGLWGTWGWDWWPSTGSTS